MTWILLFWRDKSDNLEMISMELHTVLGVSSPNRERDGFGVFGLISCHRARIDAISNRSNCCQWVKVGETYQRTRHRVIGNDRLVGKSILGGEIDARNDEIVERGMRGLVFSPSRVQSIHIHQE